MTDDRTDDLMYALRELISARDIIKGGLTALTADDKVRILGPLKDSISDCEFLMKQAYVEPDTMEGDERRAYLNNLL